MVFHHWSDKDVDWDGINNAAHYIQSYCSKWGRISGHSKEKFGTVRYYAGFGGLSLHSLIYPLYVYSKFPKWLWNLDVDYISPVLQFFFEKPFVAWQKFIYNRAYQNALKKWPHLRGEILEDADWLEYIKGSIKVDGRYTHVLGWNGEILSTWERLENDKSTDDKAGQGTS